MYKATSYAQYLHSFILCIFQYNYIKILFSGPDSGLGVSAWCGNVLHNIGPRPSTGNTANRERITALDSWVTDGRIQQHRTKKGHRILWDNLFHTGIFFFFFFSILLVR